MLRWQGEFNMPCAIPYLSKSIVLVMFTVSRVRPKVEEFRRSGRQLSTFAFLLELAFSKADAAGAPGWQPCRLDGKGGKRTYPLPVAEGQDLGQAAAPSRRLMRSKARPFRSATKVSPSPTSPRRSAQCASRNRQPVFAKSTSSLWSRSAQSTRPRSRRTPSGPTTWLVCTYQVPSRSPMPSRLVRRINPRLPKGFSKTVGGSISTLSGWSRR